MTFFHFGNCVALAYVPFIIVYRCSGLAEYSSFWKCIQAGAAYLTTQLCKMLFLATFFPNSDTPLGQINVLEEFLKCTVDLSDLIGLYLVMTQITGKGQLKFMIAGLGWASAELLMTRFIPLWVGARGIEFDWKYTQMSLNSNISLVQHISTAALVWLYSRTDLNKTVVPVVMFLLALSCYRPLLFEILEQMFAFGSWTTLITRACFTCCIGLTTLQLYLGLSVGKDMNSYY